MRITIAANIYPPEIGGPSEYTRSLFDTLLIQNHHVNVVTYAVLKQFPTGIRHFLYGCKLCIEAFDSDYIIAMDTFSVGLPAIVFATLFHKKIVIRIAGDFLWEAWCDRTKQPVLLSEFYSVARTRTLKEKIIFWITKDVLHTADTVVFSTEWQRNIMHRPYALNLRKTCVIENYYAPVDKHISNLSMSHKIFLSPSRERYIKNKQLLKKAWQEIRIAHKDVELDTHTVAHEVLLEKIPKSYAVIVPSLSEVSPNMVLDAIALGVPAVVTKDTGIVSRVHDMVVFVDPKSEEDITRGIEKILDPMVYESCKKAIASRTFFHSWNEIAQEFVDLHGRI